MHDVRSNACAAVALARVSAGIFPARELHGIACGLMQPARERSFVPAARPAR
jgi:hypothetical protein